VIHLNIVDTGNGRKIVSIGTCRCRDTVLPKNEGTGALVAYSPGFAHSIQDSIQWLEFIYGDKAIAPDFYRPFFGNDFGDPEQKWEARFRKLRRESLDCDTLVIEISSLKDFTAIDTRFNPMYVSAMIATGGGEILDWWSMASRGLEFEGEIDYVGSSKSIGVSEEFLRDFVQTMEINHCTSKIFENCFAEICERYPFFEDVVIIIPPYRSELYREVRPLADKFGFRLFDPTSYVSGIELKEVFKKEGRDINHYSNSFSETINHEFMNFLSSSASNSPTVNFHEFIFTRIPSLVEEGESGSISFRMPEESRVTDGIGIPHDVIDDSKVHELEIEILAEEEIGIQLFNGREWMQAGKIGNGEGTLSIHAKLFSGSRGLPRIGFEKGGVKITVSNISVRSLEADSYDSKTIFHLLKNCVSEAEVEMILNLGSRTDDSPKWSLGRRLQNMYSEDSELLGHIAGLGSNRTIWELYCRSYWDRDDFERAAIVAKDALERFPEDEWFIRMAGAA
tara:strand:+ start:350 stop:1873 length:1524 start_codon:yes stop_codon:yes gene_type:complete